MTTVVTNRSPRPTKDPTYDASAARLLHERPVRLDPAALAGAFDEHGRAVYGLAYRILRDHPAAEDVVQDAFLKLWTGAAQFDPARGPMLGLLLTIARHKAIDRMRSGARRQRSEGTYCIDETWTGDGPERAAERGEDARDVRSALVALPYGQRQVIEMAFFSGLTCRQIAGETALPIGTVKSRMRLGLRKLASMLGDGAMRLRFDDPANRSGEKCLGRSIAATHT